MAIMPMPATIASRPSTPCTEGVSARNRKAPTDDNIGPVPRAIG
jgi:hypothetical protein